MFFFYGFSLQRSDLLRHSIKRNCYLYPTIIIAVLLNRQFNLLSLSDLIIVVLFSITQWSFLKTLWRTWGSCRLTPCSHREHAYDNTTYEYVARVTLEYACTAHVRIFILILPQLFSTNAQFLKNGHRLRYRNPSENVICILIIILYGLLENSVNSFCPRAAARAPSSARPVVRAFHLLFRRSAQGTASTSAHTITKKKTCILLLSYCIRTKRCIITTMIIS